MAITTLGFEGTVDDVAYSKRSRFEGATLATVDGRTDFAVTNGSGDYALNVAAGNACAHGILATSDGIATLALDPVTLTGAIRWDAIALRYVWSANTVTLIKVPGAAALNAQATLPSGLRYDVGDTYDQVLALVKVAQGLTAVQEIQDRRYQGNKTFTALSKATLPPPTVQLFGVEFITADGTRWRCGLDSSNNLAWAASNSGAPTELTGTAVFEADYDNGFIVDPSHVVRCLITSPYDRQIDIQLRSFGPTINAADTDGNFGDLVIGKFSSLCSPDVQTGVSLNYLMGGTDCNGWARLTPEGNLTLLAGQPGNDLTRSTSPGTQSIRASFRFSTRKAAS